MAFKKSEKQLAYEMAYMKENYKKINIMFRKEDASAMDEHWKKYGYKSRISFLLEAIYEKIERDCAKREMNSND